MSFLSKNGAGILACLLISIVSWYLGGFFPVIGAPVFGHFHRHAPTSLSLVL
ncbi:membrane protein [Streptococcus pneumoniae]|nr:membrane protein [Streptococcus pneumoniae]